MPGTAAPSEMPIDITTSMVARSRFGVNSAFSAITFGSTPPRPSPLKKRSHNSWWRSVAKAQASVVTPIKNRLEMMASLRPNRSPNQPKKGAPTKKPTRLALNTGPSAARSIPHCLIKAGPAMLAFSRSKPSAIIASRHQSASQMWNGRNRVVSTSRLMLISFIVSSPLSPTARSGEPLSSGVRRRPFPERSKSPKWRRPAFQLSTAETRGGQNCGCCGRFHRAQESRPGP